MLLKRYWYVTKNIRLLSTFLLLVIDGSVVRVSISSAVGSWFVSLLDSAKIFFEMVLTVFLLDALWQKRSKCRGITGKFAC